MECSRVFWKADEFVVVVFLISCPFLITICHFDQNHTKKKNTVFVCVCVCVCVWVCGCVCVFVEVHSPWRLHLSGSVGMPRNRSTMLCWRPFFCVPSFSITTLEWRPKPFYLAALFCSHNRSGLSHDLTSARLAFIKIRPSFTIIRHRLRSAQYRKPIYLWRQALTRGVAM